MSQQEPSRFWALTENYRASVLAYRQFLQYVASALEKIEGERLQIFQSIDPIIREFKEDATEDDRGQFLALLDLFKGTTTQRGATGKQRVGDDAAVSDEDHEHVDDPQVTSEKAAGAFIRIWRKIRWAMPAVEHKELLYRGILIGLVGQFEVLLSDIAHCFYLRAPGAVETTEKVLSVSELKQFVGIKEAIDFVIDKRVEELLRGTAEDWCKFLESRMNVDLRPLAPDWNRFDEHIQRRHIVVHAGGRISRRYIQNVDPELLAEYFGDPVLGNVAYLSEDYIKQVQTSFEVTGLCLAFQCWIKLCPDERDSLESLLTETLYQFIVGNSWAVSIHLALWGANEDRLSAGTKTVCQMNYWLSAKRLGRFGEVQREVAECDTSALHPRFALARAALLDDGDLFFRIVEKTNGANLNREAWEEWPIFEEMRTDARFNQYKERFLGQGEVETARLDEGDGNSRSGETVES